jgi:hypothetical protein
MFWRWLVAMYGKHKGAAKMSKASNKAKQHAKVKQKAPKGPRDRRRKNPAARDPLNFSIGPAEAIVMIGLSLFALFPGLVSKVQEVLDEKGERESNCPCVCHMPRFDSMPEECRCPDGPLPESCKHFGRFFDTNGIQMFCHKCCCLKQCGPSQPSQPSQPR